MISVNRAEWQGKECHMIHITEETIVEDVPKAINIIGIWLLNCSLFIKTSDDFSKFETY